MKKPELRIGMLFVLLAGLTASCGDSGGTKADSATDGARDADANTDAPRDTAVDAPRDGDAAAADVTPDTGADMIVADSGSDADAAPADVQPADMAPADVPPEAPPTDGPVDQTPVDMVAATHSIGGTISMLAGTGLVLRNNGGNNLTVTAAATTFTFSTRLATGSAYAVTVFTQPGAPTQICTVANGSGTVGATDVTNVAITCGTQAYTVGGTITGLTGTGLVLRNNGGNNLTVPANATTFTFAQSVLSGATYAVTVQTQPTSPAQVCTVVSNGTGTVVAANVTNVAISCVTSTFTVGGTIANLTGAGLVLQNNSGNNLTVPAAATTFTFAAPVASGAGYSVTVLTQPAGQVCTVASGTGTVAAANVTNVAITCAASTFTVGGSITGLTGTGLVLRTGTTDLTVPANATTYMFPAQAIGSAYGITVQTQPGSPPQLCTVANATGTVGTANVTNAAVTCVTQFTVSGTVAGLVGTVVLRDTSTPGSVTSDVTLPSAGASTPFSFAVRVPSGGTYAVTVLTNPATQVCTVTSNGSGAVTANVTNVGVTCVTQFTVGGTVAGLTSGGLNLSYAGGANLPVASGATTFVFPGSVPGGSTFGPVTVSTQPTAPPQYCTVANGSGGTVTANVTNVAISCVTLRVGGTVGGLTTAGLTLRNGTGPALTVAATDTTFTFPAAVAANSAYGPVTVATQPTGQNCAVTGAASGTVGTTSVTNVAVTCTDNVVCGTAVEHAMLMVPCPAGQVISAITFATYGSTPPTGTCGSYVAEPTDDAGTCGGQPTADLAIVRGECPVGSAACNIQVESGMFDLFTDNCPFQAKTLTVQLSCVPM
jgi:hypothetical protein